MGEALAGMLYCLAWVAASAAMAVVLVLFGLLLGRHASGLGEADQEAE